MPGTDGEKQYNVRTGAVKKGKSVKVPKAVKVPVKRELEPATGCDNAYFAGVFDLLGHIELMGGDRKTYAMIRIATTHKVILESIQGVYGGEIRQSGHPDQGGASYLLTWPENEDAHKFLEAIAPYVRRLQSQVSALRNWLEFQVLKRYEEEVILEVLRKSVIK